MSDRNFPRRDGWLMQHVQAGTWSHQMARSILKIEQSNEAIQRIRSTRTSTRSLACRCGLSVWKPRLSRKNFPVLKICSLEAETTVASFQRPHCSLRFSICNCQLFTRSRGKMSTSNYLCITSTSYQAQARSFCHSRYNYLAAPSGRSPFANLLSEPTIYDSQSTGWEVP